MTLEHYLTGMKKAPDPGEHIDTTIAAFVHSTNNILTIALGSLQFFQDEDSKQERDYFARKIEESIGRFQHNSSILKKYLSHSTEIVDTFSFDDIISTLKVQNYEKEGMEVTVLNPSVLFSYDKTTVIEGLQTLLLNSFEGHKRKNRGTSSVGISLEEIDGSILLGYEDTCGGFGERNKLFSIHEKKENGKGFAIGLARLVRSTRKFGGEVYYDDNLNENGSVIGVKFALLYPKKEIHLSNPLSPNQESQLIGNSRKILFIDDDEFIRYFYRQYFAKEYDIVIVASAEEAEPLLKAQDFGVIWSDNSMGKGMKGIEMIKNIRANLYGKNQSTPIALFTTDSSGDLISQEQALGFSYQEKPQTKESIKATLDSLLKNPSN